MKVNKYINNTQRVFPEQGRYDYYRYDMNENPEGLPKDFVDSVLSEITPEFLAIYPEPDIFRQKYARFLNVGFENVLPTNGSDMAIRYALQTFAEPGDTVVTVSPSFEMYWVNCSILGYKHKPVMYEDDLTININKIVDAIDDNTSIVVLLNPNNPVGNVYTEEEAEAVIKRAKEVNAIVIIDEAYHYFYEKTFLDMIHKYDNVMILRTFSKLMSIAACRLGVIIAQEEIIKAVEKCKLTFDVNSIALKFGERLIERPDIIEALIKAEKEGKDYAISEFEKNGYNCRDCKGNFIFVETKTPPKELEKKLKEEKKILIKTFGKGILAKYVRLSVGSKEAMKIVVEAILELDL